MRANGTTVRVRVVAQLSGKSVTTIFRWRRQGCDLNSPASINEYLEGNKLRQNANLIRKPKVDVTETDISPFEPDLNKIKLAPAGPRGAAAALARLEEIEERALVRLMRAIEAGNPFQVKAAQEFYLRSSEVLRRLDLAVENERRNAEEHVPLRQIEDISAQISTWLRHRSSSS
jgi:hypothetical protein